MPLSQRAPLGSHSTALGDHICTENEKETKFRDFLLLPDLALFIFDARRGSQIPVSETGKIFKSGIKNKNTEHLFKKILAS